MPRSDLPLKVCTLIWAEVWLLSFLPKGMLLNSLLKLQPSHYLYQEGIYHYVLANSPFS